MKRNVFKEIIKLRSNLRVDKRMGNYDLPTKRKLSDYITELVKTQMEIDNYGIRKNGDLCFCQGGKWNADTEEYDDYTLMPAFENNEICSYEVMEERIEVLVHEITG